MTVEELRQLLSMLPADADNWPIGAVDLDQVDAFGIEGVSGDGIQRCVWINLRIEA